MKKYLKLRKQGKFYCSFDDDAYVMHSIFGYKISNGRVGFPSESLGKVINTLDNSKVDYVVIEKDKEVMKNTFSKNNYNKFFNEGHKSYGIIRYEEEIIDIVKNLPVEKLIKIIDYIKSVINE